MDNAVVFEHVRFSYDGKTDVLKDVSLEIKQNELLCILGPNGSGKSTLVRLINALLLPDEGHVKVFGMDTLDKKLTLSIRKTAGMVFQNPDDQSVADIVFEDVAFGPRNLDIDESEIPAIVKRSLERVGMQDHTESTIHTLSGGQKQRICIAGVLAMNPKLIIFDEAASMLDPESKTDFARIMVNLKKEGITSLLITHDLQLARLCDRAIIMNDGRIVADKTPEEIIADKTLLEQNRLLFDEEKIA
ncbi:MAG: ATP-binding cassette domain-containing protein [Eggerthellaceae bacterium]|nr:ATP-binding cassette domain-containing protein [Eggerthellaceae bacterium]